MAGRFFWYHGRIMCGRYSLTSSKIKIAEEFKLQEAHLKELVPSYNIAPSQPVPVLLETPEPRVGLFRWGLIPSWAKDPTIGSRMINARKETLVEKPSFRSPFRKQRCLVLADGFYEWKGEGRTKTPYYVRLKSKAPFGFAGLWSQWSSPDGALIYSCAIITGEPNELLQLIHNRMPVILRRQRRERWLDPSNHDSKELMNLLEPYPSDEMEAYPVSKLVNSPANNTSECLKLVGT